MDGDGTDRGGAGEGPGRWAGPSEQPPGGGLGEAPGSGDSGAVQHPWGGGAGQPWGGDPAEEPWDDDAAERGAVSWDALLATAAGLAGLFFFVFGFLFGPIAILLGRRARRQFGYRGGLATFGIVLGWADVVIWVVLALAVVTLLVPAPH